MKKYLAGALVIFALDQFTKWLIVQYVTLHDVIPVLGDFFGITSHRNRGAAFGILQNQRWLFVLLTIVVIVCIVIYLRRAVRGGQRLLAIGLMLVLGGALGNFSDRVLFGEVVDFVQLYFAFADYYFPNFNVADSAITVGVGLLAWDTLRGGKWET